jgi:hypothetical protein
LGESFDQDGGPLAAADAGATDPVPAAAPLQRVEEVDGAPGARGGERMPEGGRAAVHVDLLARQAVVIPERLRRG